jgi:DNA-binding transcriptional MerR regulator
MFRIGEFARFGSVSVRSLRHYHELGLLVPAEVDPSSGYRGYSVDQLAQLNRIVALKELGFSLDQIRQVISDVTLDELRGMLRLRRAQLEVELAQQHERLAQVEARLRAIEEEGAVPRDDVVIKRLPAQRVAVIGNPAPGFGPTNLEPILTPAIQQLAEILSSRDVEIVGNAFGFYEGDPEDGTLVAYVALPIGPGAVDIPAPVEIVELPEVAEAASVVMPSPTEDGYPAMYRELMRWIDTHGYEVDGHGRDVFLNTTPPKSRSEVVMEIQWPLRRVRRTAG